jgi:sec-independent protein translocase protein TatA
VGSLGTGELLIILIVVLLIFGGSQLPKLARNLGRAQNEFRRGVSEARDEEDDPRSSS